MNPLWLIWVYSFNTKAEVFMLPVVNDNMRIKYKRIKGHVYLRLNIIFEGSTYNDRVSFIYDTGAFITTINRNLYETYKLDKLPRREVTMSSYAGASEGYVFQIPGLIIGQRLLTGVWAFSPKDAEISQNLLGDNVIEYFSPVQDNHNDCFYFPDNPTPQPYIHPKSNFSLACDKVMYVDDYISNKES